jgi:hypothetical protein
MDRFGMINCAEEMICLEGVYITQLPDEKSTEPHAGRTVPQLID